MTEATTYAFTRDAINRAHAERSAVFASLFAALFGRNDTDAPIASSQAA